MRREDLAKSVRSMSDGDWYWIPRTVFEDYASKIGVVGLALYNAYSSYARDKGVAYPSQKTISEKLGISVKTVIKYNKILQENGLIKIEKGKGKGKTNLVTLLRLGNVKEGKHPTEPNSVKGVKEVQPKENNTKENTNEVDEQKSSVKEIFHYFREVVGDTKGFEPEISWAKDGRLVKLRLRKYSPEEIKSLIDWYLSSEVSERLGISLAACLSTHVINLWKASKSRKSYLDRLYPTWQMKN